MIPAGDEVLREFLMNNLDCIILLYCFLQSLFPESRLLAALRNGYVQFMNRGDRAK